MLASAVNDADEGGIFWFVSLTAYSGFVFTVYITIHNSQVYEVPLG
jgi:hypothetical protein